MIGLDLMSFPEMLAQRVRKERLARNITQAEMASRCLLSLPSYQRFESSGRTSLLTFVKILFVLDHQNDLRAILPESREVASLEEFEQRHRPPRSRARKKKNQS